jgi:hypothetical protein
LETFHGSNRFDSYVDQPVDDSTQDDTCSQNHNAVAKLCRPQVDTSEAGDLCPSAGHVCGDRRTESGLVDAAKPAR